MNYVILGAGPAGVVAAETLRKADPAGSVTLVGAEAAPPYSRMAIPYLLVGNIGEDGTYLRKTEGHYDSRGIAYVQGQADKVDGGAKTVTLRDGTVLPYDRLLIATGSHPIKPPVDGLDLPGVHHCWTLEDARAIAARATDGADVVLMGAGFIGCIILESLIGMGVNLTVVEAEDRMVPRMMDATAGGMLRRWCESKGVTVKTGTRVTGVSGSDGALSVALDSGETLNAALVVVATGVAPNVDFLDGAGVDIDQGIRVDDHMATNVDGIYAAGDVAQGRDFGGGFAVHAIQPTATEHGRIAALNMAGRDAAYKGSLVMNVLDTAGLISCSFGAWDGVVGGSSAEQVDEDGYRYLKLQFDGDCLVGALGIGRTDAIGVLRGLIQTRVRLGPWKAVLEADPHRIQEAYVACTQG